METHLPSLSRSRVMSLPFAAVAAAVVALTPCAVAATAPAGNSPAVDFAASLRAPLIAPADAISASSSSADAMEPVAFMADPAALSGSGEGMQPPPYRRRRYGRPSYSDRMHNADGSNRLAFMAGGGFTVPVGDASSNYLKTSWDFGVGGGINFSRKFGVLLQFDWANFGLPGAVLNTQEQLYSNLDPNDASQGAFQGLDGHTHIWSFTLNPTFTFHQSETLGAYAVVGGGFYHKVTTFTVPSTGTYCDPYYGYCYQYAANATLDQYISNAPGVSGGLGLTYKFSRFANQRFFAEARYVHTFNQVRYGDPNLTQNPQGVPNNFYPPNSNETSYIPITFGIRF